MSRWRGPGALLLGTMLSAAACSRAAAPPAWKPGLGEIMTLNQMRHTKLWFAGEAGNWPLAAYEIDELREGLDDAARLHPTHKDAPLPISELIPRIMTEPLKQLDAAVAARDRERFETAFDTLTRACNGCHQATNFGFNVVTRPGANPYTNQVFEPAR